MNRPFTSISSRRFSLRASWSLLTALLVTCIASGSAHAQTANSYDFRILQSFSSAAALVQIAVDPSGNVYAGDDTETKIYEMPGGKWRGAVQPGNSHSGSGHQ